MNGFERADVCVDRVFAPAGARQFVAADTHDAAPLGAIFEYEAVQQRAGCQRDSAQVC